MQKNLLKGQLPAWQLCVYKTHFPLQKELLLIESGSVRLKLARRFVNRNTMLRRIHELRASLTIKIIFGQNCFKSAKMISHSLL